MLPYLLKLHMKMLNNRYNYFLKRKANKIIHVNKCLRGVSLIKWNHAIKFPCIFKCTKKEFPFLGFQSLCTHYEVRMAWIPYIPIYIFGLNKDPKIKMFAKWGAYENESYGSRKWIPCNHLRTWFQEQDSSLYIFVQYYVGRFHGNGFLLKTIFLFGKNVSDKHISW